jgi:hypothetical protein
LVDSPNLDSRELQFSNCVCPKNTVEMVDLPLFANYFVQRLYSKHTCRIYWLNRQSSQNSIFKFRRNFNRSRCGWLCMWVCLYKKLGSRLQGLVYHQVLQYKCIATRRQSKCTATVKTADDMCTECTVLFRLAQAHFTNQTISMQN